MQSCYKKLTIDEAYIWQFTDKQMWEQQWHHESVSSVYRKEVLFIHEAGYLFRKTQGGH
jgi:hypothetical protein